MKIETYTKMEYLQDAHIVAKCLNKKVSDIYETDLMFSFRAYTDNGQFTKQFHQFLKRVEDFKKSFNHKSQQ